MAKGKYQKWLEPEGLLKIEGWARDGLTDEQIAHNMGITPKTLYRWKEEHCQICQSLKRGKDVVDRAVENALLKRALGCTVKEKTTMYDDNGDVTSEKVIEKDIPPDTTAQIFWLKNRKPEEWRDKRDIGLSGEVETKNPFADLTTEELKRIIKDG